MYIPSDYIPGYAKARAAEPEIASNYVAHTLIGDPEADALIDQLAPLDARESARLIKAAMNNPDDDMLRAGGTPSVVRDFFKRIEAPPDWVDHSDFRPGIRMFHRNSRLVLAGMLGGTLVEGFSTNISKSFFITGRLRDQGVRRLKQNNRHMVEIFLPGGLARGGDGWTLSVRIRLIHAQVRHLLSRSNDWNTEAWGIPISSAHLGFAIVAFSARLLRHLKALGARFNAEERRSFMAVWRYSGFLMGIPETILFKAEADALKLFEIGGMCEPPIDWEAIAMSNSLVNSAPLFVGKTVPAERRRLAKYVYQVSRALIENSLADQLRYRSTPTLGVLPWFRLQSFYYRFMAKRFPKRAVHNNFTDFTGLLEASAFDQEGISYTLPQHAYAEESGKW